MLINFKNERRAKKYLLNIINALNSAEKVLKLSCSDIEINVSFVTRLQIKKLNNQTRNVNKVTDVLSYPHLNLSVIFDMPIFYFLKLNLPYSLQNF